jgi:hypothetical protein
MDITKLAQRSLFTPKGTEEQICKILSKARSSSKIGAILCIEHTPQILIGEAIFPVSPVIPILEYPCLQSFIALQIDRTP